jgi:NitT/TauT family transport system substrate-binding protein
VQITNFATNETPQALGSGGVDAVAAWYPVSGQALKQVPGAKALFTSKDLPGLIYDGLFVGRDSLSAHKADWAKVAKVWFKTVEFIKNPATHDEAVKIMAARVNVKPEEYARSMEGTHLLDLEANLKALKEGDGFDSVYGSSKVANAFNLKYGVYKESQDIKSYVTDEFVKAIAEKK